MKSILMYLKIHGHYYVVADEHKEKALRELE